MHESVRWLVELNPKVFTLLFHIHDGTAGHLALEGSGVSSDFAVHDGIILSLDSSDCAVEAVLLEEMHNTCNFTDLSNILMLASSRKLQLLEASCLRAVT